MINRKDFKVTMSTKVCSNHFSLGYRCKESCRTPTLYMKGYEEKPESGNRRPAPRVRGTVKLTTERKRKIDDEMHSGPINPRDRHLHLIQILRRPLWRKLFHTLKRNFNLNRNTSDNVIHTESEDKQTQTEWPHQHDQKGPLFWIRLHVRKNVIVRQV